MKLTITIPEDKYRYIRELEQDNTDYATTRMLYHAVKHGKPYSEQEPKTGHWVEVKIRNCRATLKCSVCDRVIEPTFTFGEYSYEDINRYYPYCHCGTKMQEVEE